MELNGHMAELAELEDKTRQLRQCVQAAKCDRRVTQWRRACKMSLNTW